MFSLPDRVREAQRRLGVAPIPDSPPETEMVQLAIRVPARLRRLIHEAARAAGAASTQQWVVEVLTKAGAEARDPSRALRARYLEELSDRVGAKIADGSYEQFAAAVDDPDLS